MKKQDILLIVGAVGLVLISMFALQGTKAIDIELPMMLTGTEKELTEIDYATYKEKIDNNENFIVIIEKTGCSFCEKYMPIVEEVASEREMPIYYIDTSTLTQTELSDLEKSNVYLRTENWGTPTTLLLSGSNVAASIGEYVDKEEFEEFIDINIKFESE